MLKSLTKMQSFVDVVMNNDQEVDEVKINPEPVVPAQGVSKEEEVKSLEVANVVESKEEAAPKTLERKAILRYLSSQTKLPSEIRDHMTGVLRDMYHEGGTAELLEKRVREYDSEHLTMARRQEFEQMLREARSDIIPNFEHLRGRMYDFFNSENGQIDLVIRALTDSQMQALADGMMEDDSVYPLFMMEALEKFEKNVHPSSRPLFDLNSKGGLQLFMDMKKESDALEKQAIDVTSQAAESGFIGRMLGAVENKEVDDPLVQYVQGNASEAPITVKVAESIRHTASFVTDLAQRLGKPFTSSSPDKTDAEKTYSNLLAKHNSWAHAADVDYAQGMDGTDVKQFVKAFNALPKDVQEKEDWSQVAGLIEHAWKSALLKKSDAVAARINDAVIELEAEGIMKDRMATLRLSFKKIALDKSAWKPKWKTKTKIAGVVGGLMAGAALVGALSKGPPDIRNKFYDAREKGSGSESKVAFPIDRNISGYASPLEAFVKPDYLGSDAPQMANTFTKGLERHDTRDYHSMVNLLSEIEELYTQAGTVGIEHLKTSLVGGEDQTLKDLKGILEGTSQLATLLTPLVPSMGGVAKGAAEVGKTLKLFGPAVTSFRSSLNAWNGQIDPARAVVYWEHGGRDLYKLTGKGTLGDAFGYGTRDWIQDRGVLRLDVPMADVINRPTSDPVRQAMAVGVTNLRQEGVVFPDIVSRDARVIMENTMFQSLIATDRSPTDEVQLFVDTILTESEDQDSFHSILPTVPLNQGWLGPYYQGKRMYKEWVAGSEGVKWISQQFGTKEGLNRIIAAANVRFGGDKILMGKVTAGLQRIHEAREDMRADETINFIKGFNELNLHVTFAALVQDNIKGSAASGRVEAGTGVLEAAMFSGPQYQGLSPLQKDVAEVLYEGTSMDSTKFDYLNS